jgi:hypothetical protein
MLPRRIARALLLAGITLQQANAVLFNTMTPPLAYFEPFYVRMHERSCFEFTGISYHRSADSAYCPTAVRTQTVPLSTLLFGRADFTIAQAFPDANIANAIPDNPFVGLVELSPRFNYNENGVFFNAQMTQRFGCDDQWSAGFRARVPFRDITVAQTANSNIQGRATLEDFFATRVEIPEGGPTQSIEAFAARLDFLNALDLVSVNANGSTEPMVIFANPDSSNHITIASQDATGVPTNAATPANVTPSVAVIGSTKGTLPVNERWADYPSTIATTVTADGSGVDNTVRANFDPSVDYSALASNAIAQRQLYVVPSIADNGAVAQGAVAMLSAIQAAVTDIQQDAGQYLIDNGINLSYANTQGLGNVDFELFVARDFFNSTLRSETNFGLRLPTDTQIRDNRNLLEQPSGNGKHLEVRLGQAFAWQPCSRAAMSANMYYSWVINHTEMFAAPFKGATIKNLLPPFVQADLAWGYFLGNFDLTLYATKRCGFDFGYQVFAKTSDHVQLRQQQALDLLGTIAPLDACNLTRNTGAVSHRLKTEFFLSTSCCDLFSGFAHTVAGKNTACETDWYLGLRLGF